MTSLLAPSFFKEYKKLPKDVQKQARTNYKLWKNNPSHPSLEYKEITLRSGRSVWSARITNSYRVLGSLEDEEMVWFWCGSHTEYDKKIEAMRKASGGI